MLAKLSFRVPEKGGKKTGLIHCHVRCSVAEVQLANPPNGPVMPCRCTATWPPTTWHLRLAPSPLHQPGASLRYGPPGAIEYVIVASAASAPRGRTAAAGKTRAATSGRNLQLGVRTNPPQRGNPPSAAPGV